VSPTRVLVADALPIFRSGVCALLRHEADFVPSEADSLAGVLGVIAEGCPDVALVDLDLPPCGGVAAVERLGSSCAAHTIVWSFEPTRESVLAAVRAGANGFLRKEIEPQELLRALRAAAQGEAPLSPGVATLLVDALHGFDERSRIRERASVLSARELEVLELISRGARNKQIARELVISEFTVKRHVQNILQKLELSSRRAAATFYRSAFDAGDLSEVAARLA
jgi:two-component system nitrate/nitrite response regulator NarL